MTTALSADQRSALEKLVQRARRWIEDDLEAKLAGIFGINPDGRIEDIAGLSLSNAQASVRDDLVEIITFLRSEGEGDEGSVARLVREAAFTHTNRLIAVRVAEAIGLLPEAIAKGTASTGFRDFSELAPTVATTEWGRFAEFLRLCADELAADVPALFDPRNPLLELTISEQVLAKVIEAISTLGNELWAAPDTLGWAYQFFNTGEERREMRESSAPRNSRELAVRNQFFTPSYVVEFLVHNGLGAHLAAGFPDLADELPLLVEVPTERVEVDLAAVSVLDPACGSGHFLLGAYDVLERAWHHAGVEPAEAAPAIVRSLWGIDIDPRAAQIAQAAVMFRARRHCRDKKLPPANVICARSLPSGPEIDAFIASLPDHVGRAVQGIAEELVDAPILGPLLKIEERLDREVRDIFGTGVVQGTLAESAVDESDNVEAAVLGALSAIADSTTATAYQRLFATEARDAVRFVEAMSRKYAAVLMNPPFGAFVPESRTYVRQAYPHSYADAYAAFVDRGASLLEEGGTLGAITNRTGFFLRSLTPWRQSVLRRHPVRTFVDLGLGVLQGAFVEVACYVLAAPYREHSAARFYPLLSSSSKAEDLLKVVTTGKAVLVDVDEFMSIPNEPYAYHVPAEIRDSFADAVPFEGRVGEARVGLQTDDDFRFVRAWWEVPQGQIGEKWLPLAKGGEYAPYFGPPHLVVNWAQSGEEMRNFQTHELGYSESRHIQNVDYYFREGVTWTHRTNSAFAPRLLPSGSIFGIKGPSAFPLGEVDLHLMLGVLSSRPVRALIEVFMSSAESTASGSASRSYDVGIVQQLPWPDLEDDEAVRVSQLTKEVVGQLRARASYLDETSTAYDGLDLDGAEDVISVAMSELRHLYGLATSVLAAASEIDALVAAAYGWHADTVSEVADLVGVDTTQFPAVVGDIAAVRASLLKPLREVVADAAQMAGASRSTLKNAYIVDRRLELISESFRIHPRAVLDVAISETAVSAEDLVGTAERLVSWLVGGCFGRFRDLSDNGGAEVVPSVLIDAPGQARSLSVRLAQYAEELGIPHSLLQSASEALGSRDLHSYLHRQFFGDHLSRYTRSRRKAPIYWQLQVPSKTWGLWLYAPKLSREILFAIVRETEHRQRLAEQQIGHLQREAETGSGGRKASEVAKELEAEQKLAVELASFRTEAERIANLGWEPDLDDGMVLNAAPLADLFPAWKDAAAYRKELRAGRYEWATVARYADQL